MGGAPPPRTGEKKGTHKEKRRRRKERKKGRKAGRQEGRKEGRKEGKQVPTFSEYLTFKLQESQRTPTRINAKEIETATHLSTQNSGGRASARKIRSTKSSNFEASLECMSTYLRETNKASITETRRSV